MQTNENWTIEARENFAVGGETIQLFDENNQTINISQFFIKGLITNWGRADELTVASGNFAVIPFVSPATYPSQWEFKLSVNDVNALKDGRNYLKVIVSDATNQIVAEFDGTIIKK